MMKAKSPHKNIGHGQGDHGKHGSDRDAKNVIKRANKGDPGSQQYNAKKTAKKTAKSEEKKLRASEANASLQRKYEANMDSGKGWKEMSGKDRRETKSLGRKANRANKKANVAESVRKYEGSKLGNYMEKPTKTKPKRQGGSVVARKNLLGLGKVEMRHSLGSGRKKESEKNKTQRKKDNKDYKKDKKDYNKNKGLRGAINARRTGKGKDKI